MNLLLRILYATAIVLCFGGQQTKALDVHVAVVQTGTNFSYTLYNDEPTNSSSHLNAFHLVANAPFEVASTPPGWDFATDSFSYVDWFASTNCGPPYTNHIAPASSLEGFAVRSKISMSESLSYALTSWDHKTTNTGPGFVGSVQAPSILTVEPTLTNISTSISNTFQFTLIGIPFYSYAIEKSTNLIDWSLLTTNSSPFTFIVTNTSSLGPGFLRALFVPDPSETPPD